MNFLCPADRLIVAADFRPDAPHGRNEVRRWVLELADELVGTEVYLKINSALRACGYDLIREIHERGLRVFADLKLVDIGQTLATDGVLIREARPALLTTMCNTGLTALKALKAELPSTEVLGVTALTSLNDADTQGMFGCTVQEAVMRFAQVAADAKIDGLICSSKEVAMLRGRFGDSLSLNTPAIRPKWATVAGDDQSPDRIMTPAEAIRCGATRIVVGRPITKPPNGMTSLEAVMRTLDEIACAA